jgi:hypothetical protein
MLAPSCKIFGNFAKQISWNLNGKKQPMKRPPKQWPDNVEQLRIADLPVGALDQPMMRLIRKIADQTGWTVEEVMLALVERCVAERKLEAKIIPFPKTSCTSRKFVRGKVAAALI